MKVCWSICKLVKCESYYEGAFNRPMCKHHKNQIYDLESWQKDLKNDMKGHQHDMKAVDDLMSELPEQCLYETEMAVSQ